MLYAPRVQAKGAYELSEIEIQTVCERTIRELLKPPVKFRQDPTAFSTTDFVYRLTGLNSDLCVDVDVRQRIRRGNVQVLEAVPLSGGCAARMLFTEYVADNVGALLRDRGFWYADAQGNAFLEVPGELLVSVSGRRPPRPPTPKGQHYTAAGAKVLYDLLRRGPRMEATYREMRETTGVSIDKIGKVIREIEKDGLLRVHGAGDYGILDAGRLLERWYDAYKDKLAPDLALGGFRSPDYDLDSLVERAVELLGEQVVVGGEVAGDVYTGQLRPGILRLYAPRERIHDLCRTLHLAPSEDGFVELCDLYSYSIAGRNTYLGARATAPAFAFAELMAEDDDRLAETAVRLRKELLAWTLQSA